MHVRMAAVYKLQGFYLVHSLMRVPDGFWVSRPPFERLDEIGLDLAQLGAAATAAIDGSAELATNPSVSESQDAELLRAAGIKSWKKFVGSAATCTLRVEEDGVDVEVRGESRADKGSHWIPDPDAVRIDRRMTAELGEVIRSLLAR